MDRIDKALKKLLPKEREWVRATLHLLSVGITEQLDIKKLKGREDIFRVRKGTIRIVYHIKSNRIFILAIDRRNDGTYRR